MPEFLRTSHAVLLFSEDPVYLNSSSQYLREAGFQILNSGNGFETIELSASGRVEAVLLDLDHNRSEVTLIATEIKRARPQVPTIVLTDGPLPEDGFTLADALVPKEKLDKVLASLDKILSDSQWPSSTAR